MTSNDHLHNELNNTFKLRVLCKWKTMNVCLVNLT